MPSILGVEEAREQYQMTHTLGPGVPGSARRRQPGQDSRHPDVRLTTFIRIAGERLQVTCSLAQLVSERATKLDVAIDVFVQHGSLPPQGCAISDRRAMSTLA